MTRKILCSIGILALALIALSGCNGEPGTPTPTATPSAPFFVPNATIEVEIQASGLGVNRIIKVESERTIIINTRATGDNLAFDWELVGEGTLDHDGVSRGEEGYVNRYTAPRIGPDEKLEALLNVTVTDQNNLRGEDQVYIQVIPRTATATPPPTATALSPTATTAPTATPTPTAPTPPPTATLPPTETPTPTPTPIPTPVPTDTPRPCAVTITSPGRGSQVDPSISVQGTATTGCLAGPPMWLMVAIGGHEWAQVAPLDLFPSGTPGELGWLSDANVGGGLGDANKNFTLKVITAPPAVNQRLVEWLRAGQTSGDFPGIPTTELAGLGARALIGVPLVRN